MSNIKLLLITEVKGHIKIIETVWMIMYKGCKPVKYVFDLTKKEKPYKDKTL